ncbi:MAG TPA: hypothetical protein VGM11_09180 [Acidobacteriaceae bacterium]
MDSTQPLRFPFDDPARDPQPDPEPPVPPLPEPDPGVFHHDPSAAPTQQAITQDKDPA